ncbi:MAG: outer membrane protein assembly factor BamB [Rhodoferax sp.]|nr:outer membrane protein assembly factor BamB [Rhodoferax sp.]
MSWRPAHATARRVLGLAAVGLLTWLLGACSSTPETLKPAELGPNPALIGVRLAWVAQTGPIEFPLDMRAAEDQVVVGDSKGRVTAFDAGRGERRWQAELGQGIGAGMGGDARWTVALTRGNELVALEAGQQRWRQPVGASGSTPPLIAGGRVFLMTADRTVSAWDMATGRRLWSQSRQGEPLVLRQAGLLMAVRDTLVVGLGGRLTGLNPGNGTIRWEVALASPRGSNDVERLVDILAGVARQGDTVCVRAFQSAVGCVDAVRGELIWSRSASGTVGLHGNEQIVVGSEGDGRLVAWRRTDGVPLWSSDRLRQRGLTAPLVVGRSIAVGDRFGYVHWLSREDGSLLARMATDGSPVVGPPVRVGDTLVVATRKGGLFGFRPD